MVNKEQEFFDFVWKNEAAILAGNGFVDCYIGSIHPPHNTSSGEAVIYDSNHNFVDSIAITI